MSNLKSAAILISGSGSNLQAIIDAQQHSNLPLNIRVVISNKANATGLQRAAAADIPTCILDHTKYANREEYDAALTDIIENYGAQLVILAGFMRILTQNFVSKFAGRLVNIHPSLLPEFRGLNTHQRVLDANCTQHGASVHFVTPGVDEGPVIIQAHVDVKPGDDAASLAARVLEMEHQIYPIALRLIAQDRIKINKDTLTFDNKPLKQPLHYPDCVKYL